MQVEHVIDSPATSPFPNLSGPDAALFAILEEADRTGVGYNLCAQTLEQLGVDFDALLDVVLDAVDPRSYVRRVAGFRVERQAFRWVSVVDLPSPHNPSKLPKAVRQQFSDVTAAAGRHRAWTSATRREERRETAVRAWRAHLTTDSLDGWRLLDVDWRVIVQHVRDVWDAVESTWSRSAVEAAVQELPAHEQGPTRSMFFDPITWPANEVRLTNGQHRALAMHVQHVPDVLVVAF